MENETIPDVDVYDPEALEPVDDATALFMKSMETSTEEDGVSEVDDDEKPNTEDEAEDATSEEEVEETDEQDETDDDAEDTTDEDDDQVDDVEDQEDDEGTLVADDDATVTFMVNGEEQTASVSELKRLAGQEKALTTKSKKVAAEAKQLEQLNAATNAILKNSVEKAKSLYEQYQNVDWRAAARGLEDGDYAQLEKEAREAETEYRYVLEELDKSSTQQTEAAQQRRAAEAQAAVEAIQDPTLPTYIPEWSDKTYSDIRGYMVSQGMEQVAADNVTDPAFISMAYKAMTADKSKVAAKKTIKKAKLSPKKIAKTTKRQAKTPKGNRKKVAMKTLRSDPDALENAADAFLASFED